MPVRLLTVDDIPAVLAVQADAYVPSLIESEETFLRKLSKFPRGCFGFFEGDVLAAYLFSHPWQGDGIVPLDSGTLELPREPDCLYIHDLAVSRAHRGKGVSTQMMEALMGLADTLHLRRFVLVAVQNSESFWARWGFKPREKLMYAADMPATRMVLERPSK